MSTATLSRTLEDALGVSPVSMRPLSGGCIGEVYRVFLPEDNPFDRPSVVIKFDPGPSASLDIEGHMLKTLKSRSDLPVPEVFHSTEQLLVMEWLPGRSTFSMKAQEHAAELMASLHQVRGNCYGLESDTLIGGIHQPNTPNDSWLNFFREERIMHMARYAHQDGDISTDLLKRLEKFCDRIDEWLEEPQYPALLHGDAWTTNILAEGDRITGFIDPAIYYGHPEIELAFTTLFGTFGDPFFRRYHEINPIADGFFELRRDLYNLYPLLVHVRIFGSSYAADVDSTLRRIGC